jgi:hypothetical protein
MICKPRLPARIWVSPVNRRGTWSASWAEARWAVIVTRAVGITEVTRRRAPGISQVSAAARAMTATRISPT